MLVQDREKRLAEFVDWVGQHLWGDEKGEAPLFLDRLFRAFGHEGSIEAGADPEKRIKKGKGTSFADLVWGRVALVEMKKRGENLAKHFRQAADYWWNLTPKPQYVVLCNFDELWVYDFNVQVDSPLDRVALKDLPRRWGALAFLFPRPEKPVFGNDQVAVTRKAANGLAECFNGMVAAGRRRGPIPRPDAQRFLLQMLVALFAEDIGLLPKYLVAALLEECTEPAHTYDLLGGLFDAMNTPGRTPGGRFAGTEYFNGGLFAQPTRLELNVDEVARLRAAAKEDWGQVRPEFFGTLFEHSLGKEERHAFGGHFTSAADILKIVRPTIVVPWTERIGAADTLTELRQL